MGVGNVSASPNPGLEVLPATWGSPGATEESCSCSLFLGNSKREDPKSLFLGLILLIHVVRTWDGSRRHTCGHAVPPCASNFIQRCTQRLFFGMHQCMQYYGGLIQKQMENPWLSNTEAKVVQVPPYKLQAHCFTACPWPFISTLSWIYSLFWIIECKQKLE